VGAGIQRRRLPPNLFRLFWNPFLNRKRYAKKIPVFFAAATLSF